MLQSSILNKLSGVNSEEMKLKQTGLSYKQQLVRVGQRLCLSTLMFFAIPAALVKAQIVPDGSLPTSVEQQGENKLNINGGEREGNNLFHSFEEFSVPEGIETVFENASDIENIFTRITGDTASSINGILKTQGEANFFLVNSNGIVFGENASLDVGGSFVATTANSIQFEDDVEFTTVDTGEQPILTLSVPIGLQFDGSSGAIAVNGAGNQITPVTPFSPTSIRNSNGLKVKSRSTLALIGSNITANGGTISADGGQIELGSLDSGLVGLQSTQSGFAFNYDSVNNYQNIDLTNLSALDSSGNSQGTISLTGNNIALKNGSQVLNQNQGTSAFGDININAVGTFAISGTSPDGNISGAVQNEALNTGQSGDINFSVGRLILKDGASIGVNNFGDALGGNVTINAVEEIQLLENTAVNQSRQGFTTSSIGTVNFGEGGGGNTEISTQQLTITNGGVIGSPTLGMGAGGNVTVEANSIDLIRGVISASSTNTGSAGSVNVITSSLQLLEGGSIRTASVGTGSAGNVDVTASESISISGTSSVTQNSSSINSSVRLPSEEARELFGILETPEANAGNVSINTPFLSLAEEGSISVENQSLGEAGTLSINAAQINLGNTGRIDAASASGTGGNIDLRADQLQLDENSSITATAEKDGNGGNVNINTTNLIAKKNSEVTANAFRGRGGNLEVNAEGLFLFDSPENIFSASSELGIDGEIQIDTPEIDLQKELEQSELELLTAEQAIANSCLARSSQQGSFTIDDNGGLPKNPNSNYSDANFSLTGVSRLSSTTKQPSEIPENSRQQNSSAIPAQKMVETESGRIFLLAAPQKPESIYCKTKAESRRD